MPQAHDISASVAPLLLTDARMATAEVFQLSGGRAVFYSDRCPDKDGPNEDAASIIPVAAGRTILAVADGMGGRPLGAEASRSTLQSLCDASARVDPSTPGLRATILDALEHANQDLVSRGVGAATTAAIVEIDEGWLRPYHVGDSTVVVVGQRGKVKVQTIAHSPVGYAVEAGLLDESEAMHHEERHLISNMVGSADMRIEMGSRLKLAPYDTVLLASDGLADNLDSAEITEIIRRGPLEKVAARLVATAQERMHAPREGEPSKLDDLTFILYRAQS